MKKNTLEIAFEILVNCAFSLERVNEYQRRLVSCDEKNAEDLHRLQESNKKDNLSHKESESNVELRLQYLRSLAARNEIQAKINFETRYFNSLVHSGLNAGIQNFLDEWVTPLFQERRILFNINKQRFLLFLASFPDGEPPFSYPNTWLPIQNNVVPDFYLRVQGLEKILPKDNKNLKVDIEIKHLLSEKQCDFCQKTFYSFTKTKRYCCDECKDNAYDERRRTSDYQEKKQSITSIVNESRGCPICHEEYHGKARTCGRYRCRKAEQRKREKNVSTEPN
ncbi:MAG: hypothetical protein WCK53_14725 [Methanomicrobiales archaeon]